MMQYITKVPISMLITFAAIAGVSLHDTKLDKLTASLVGLPAVMTTTDGNRKFVQSDPHTHVERVTLNEMRSMSPRIAPRHNQQKKYLHQKNANCLQHGFDSYSIAI